MRGPGYDGAYPARLVVRAAATGVTTGALRAATRSRRRPRPRAARLRRAVRFVAHTGPPDRYDPRVPNCRDGTRALDFDAEFTTYVCAVHVSSFLRYRRGIRNNMYV